MYGEVSMNSGVIAFCAPPSSTLYSSTWLPHADSPGQAVWSQVIDGPMKLSRSFVARKAAVIASGLTSPSMLASTAARFHVSEK